ncbi:hypothetical protein [Citrobacter sedlakii]|uniref:hypothetical protein n=1 Tax=Citrobacter sedlakii TaxID=67826 RepID=UPI003339030E
MKCYLANTSNGHFITANEAATSEPGPLTCFFAGVIHSVTNADVKVRYNGETPSLGLSRRYIELQRPATDDLIYS